MRSRHGWGVVILFRQSVLLCCVGLQGDSGASLLNGLGERLREYVADSNEALSFRLVRSAGAAGRDDLDEVTAEEAGREGDFPPEMTHQIYGEK